MKKTLLLLMAACLFLPVFHPVPAQAEAYSAGLDTSRLYEGIVTVSIPKSAPSSLLKKLLIQSDVRKQIYTLPPDFVRGDFPLPDGSGIYTVTLYEQVRDNQYKRLQTSEVTLQSDDPDRVYLQSIQPIAWNRDMASIKKAQQLTVFAANDEQKAENIYRYLVQRLEYDYAKGESALPVEYTPDIEATFETGQGICYDAAALFAAMLRSTGVPVKLVKGYAPNIKEYHAWNEVFVKGKGWMTIDVTSDAQYVRAGLEPHIWKDGSLYGKQTEF